jgi:hypothetical protein
MRKMVTWLNPGKERKMVTWLNPCKEEENGYMAESR